tara:strand:+ start:451 stop:690 length:240 start_codon:yes stop_codon:yes gene_type:complete
MPQERLRRTQVPFRILQFKLLVPNRACQLLASPLLLGEGRFLPSLSLIPGSGQTLQSLSIRSLDTGCQVTDLVWLARPR